jgi:hypothetical protein
MKKQLTAVEYIKEKLMCDEYWYENLTFEQIFEQAKEMEKEQTIESYKAGVWDLGCKSADSEEYYNRTFKQEEQCKCGQPKVGGYSCQRTDCNQTFKQQEQ